MSAVLKTPISRISVSLPEALLHQLDDMVCGRGYDSRSQAIADMINQQLAEHRRELGENVMAGTITLIYNHATPGLQKQLTDIQHRHLSEVISSLHVHLMDAHTLEVLLVQGPARRLQVIADALLTCRGVITGKLHLTNALLPPVHPLPDITTPPQEENRP
jgi:CopG family transcriptional regulator, nickel-responsive regulator